MPKTYSRSEWGARPPKPGPGLLFGATVQSIALHWPAMTRPLTTVADVMAALRAWQAFHMDDKGWSDIAYQEAYDNAGNTYILRGLDTQSGANGDEDGNEENGALLLILAPGEQPSPAMMKAVRGGVARHRALFRNSRGVKGHADVRPEPTACPGPIVLALIRTGAFEPSPVRAPIRRALRVATSAIKEVRDLGYPGFADRLKAAREAARKNHSR
jgi:hypothetical protein